MQREISMKNLWAIVAMLFVFGLTAAPAEAKKFGGGKIFGKTQQTAPAPTTRPDASKQTAAPASTGKKGMLGGLMGGLLAGGLIAALFGGAFEGLQFMDILIMALLGFVILKLLRRRVPATASGPAYAGPVPQQAERSAFQSIPAARDPVGSVGGFGASSVPFNLPAGFDVTAFMVGAREHYRTLQDAWNKNDFSKIQEYVNPELYNALREERATLSGDQHTEVLFVDAELVRADHNAQQAEISIKFSGRYRDSVDGVEEDIADIWHLERDLTQSGSPWHIVGIEG